MSGLLPHLADLVERILPISTSVFEIVMSGERPVYVPGDCTVLRRFLEERKMGEGKEIVTLCERESERMWQKTTNKMSILQRLIFIISCICKDNFYPDPAGVNDLRRAGAPRVVKKRGVGGKIGSTECSLPLYRSSTTPRFCATLTSLIPLLILTNFSASKGV